MSCALGQDDVLEFSKLFEAEFNQPDLHDRVLVFDVVELWPFEFLNTNEGQEIENESKRQTEFRTELTEDEITEAEYDSVNTSDENKVKDCCEAKHDEGRISIF